MFAVVFIPNFLLQSALRLEPELRSRAVALIDSELAKATVMQLTRTARARGVTGGLTASQAMARCEDLIIRNRSHAQEQSATEVLLQTAAFFAAHRVNGPGAFARWI